MQIKLDLVSCPHGPLIRKWCSVSRTIDLALRALNGEESEENTLLAIDELTELQPMLDWLHSAVRNAINVSEAELKESLE